MAYFIRHLKIDEIFMRFVYRERQLFTGVEGVLEFAVNFKDR